MCFTIGSQDVFDTMTVMRTADLWRRRIYLKSVVGLLMLGVLAPAAWAEEGLFEITRGELRLEDGQWLLDGRVDLELSAAAIEALESGIMLSIQMQFELTRQRRFWIDETVAVISRDYELQYLALSQRYLIRDVGSGEQQSYATLYSAIRKLGQIRDWPVFADSILEDAVYYCGLRAILNQERLPGPLQMLAFWEDDFTLESDWYRWRLR